MRLIHVVCALIVTLAGCAGQDAAAEPDGTEGVVTGKADRATPAPPNADTALTRLATLLNRSGVVRMPPPGRAFHANEMTASADIVAVADDDALRALVATQSCELGKKYGAECGPTGFPFFTYPDTHASYLSGWNETTIRTFVAAQLVTSASQAEARTLLGALGNATWVHVTIYDAGAEIYGDDVVIVTPSGVGKALVLHVDYVQS